MNTKINTLVDPHFRKMGEVFFSANRQRLNTVAEAVWRKDAPVPLLEAIALRMPPRRLQLAEPELVTRYRSNKVTGFK